MFRPRNSPEDEEEEKREKSIFETEHKSGGRWAVGGEQREKYQSKNESIHTIEK